jgi:hypothetical protein
MPSSFVRPTIGAPSTGCPEASKTRTKARVAPTCVKFAVRGVWTLCTIINQKSMFLLVGLHTGLASWAHMLVLLGDIEGSCLSRRSAWVAVRVYVPKIAYFVELPILSAGSTQSGWRHHFGRLSWSPRKGAKTDQNIWPLLRLHIREEKSLQLVHFALFLVKISINFSPSYSTVFFFSSHCTSLLYKNFKILVQKF